MPSNAGKEVEIVITSLTNQAQHSARLPAIFVPANESIAVTMIAAVRPVETPAGVTLPPGDAGPGQRSTAQPGHDPSRDRSPGCLGCFEDVLQVLKSQVPEMRLHDCNAAEIVAALAVPPGFLLSDVLEVVGEPLLQLL